MTKTGPFAETINNKNPGPGNYEPMKKVAKIGFTMRGKIIPPQSEAEKVPGPGQCSIENMQMRKMAFSRRADRCSTRSTTIIRQNASILGETGSKEKKMRSQDQEITALQGPNSQKPASTQFRTFKIPK